MNVGAWTFTMVAASFALYIGVAIWSRARSTGEFYIAAAQVHPVMNGMATAADWMSAASFISMAGLIAFMGYDGSVYLMGWTGGYVCWLCSSLPISGSSASSPSPTSWAIGITRRPRVSWR
jgi:cation/acetate symporter